MSYPTNIVQAVQTYQKSALAYMQNYCCFLDIANKKFQNFQNIQANLGSSVTFDLPYRFVTNVGLPATYQPIQQYVATLTVDQSWNTAYTVFNEQEIFNLGKDDFLERITKGAIQSVGATIESTLAMNANSSVPVYTVGANNVPVPTGALHTESGPVRFYGDGVTPLTSYQQLAQAIVNFRNTGMPSGDIKVILPDTIIPAIIGSGLNQFAPKRNDDIAMSWELGEFGSPRVKYYQSNLLPTHVAGTIGQAGDTLTVVSTNDPTGANITQITFSGAGTDANAIKQGDLLQFKWDVSGQPDLFYLTEYGYIQSGQPVQVRAIANAPSSGGNVTVTIAALSSIVNGGLSSQAGANQNIAHNIVAGMQATVLPSHKCGLIIGGDAFFLALPRLPNTTPFPSASETDMATGASLRMYYGFLMSQASQAIVHDMVAGSLVVPKYSMRIALPI